MHGDTTSALAGALAANTAGIPLVHLEAGLRSFDRAMPEEHNRVLIDHLADLCCTPTPRARDNLLAERVSLERIEITGNTIVEAVTAALPDDQQRTRILRRLGLSNSRYVLATIHRPENTDNAANLATILQELTALPAPVVFPLHPRTRRQIATFGFSDLAARLHLTPPLDYPVLLALIRHAAGLVTDSGGIHEEATVLKRPILVVRRSNERPEVEEAFGCRTLPGSGIKQIVTNWLDNAAATSARLVDLPTPYGDGNASIRTISAMRSRYGTTDRSISPLKAM